MDGACFELEKGKICVISGSDGSGKSTLMNMMGEIDSLYSGEIYVDGENISAMNKKQITEYSAGSISGNDLTALCYDNDFCIYRNIALHNCRIYWGKYGSFRKQSRYINAAYACIKRPHDKQAFAYNGKLQKQIWLKVLKITGNNEF